jgi:hypothetical protein
VVILGLFDLVIALALLVLLVSSIAPFVRPRAATAGKHVRGRLVVSLAGIGIFILFNVVYFNGFGTDPVISSPTAAQVAGTWVGSGGAKLVLRPDGTFTASRLPPHVGQPTDFPVMVSGRNPPAGHGTWVIGPGEFNGPPESVIFSFTCSAPGDECTNLNLTIDLQAESSSPSGGPALFYYQGDPDDWSDQYAFTRQ